MRSPDTLSQWRVRPEQFDAFVRRILVVRSASTWPNSRQSDSPNGCQPRWASHRFRQANRQQQRIDEIEAQHCGRELRMFLSVQSRTEMMPCKRISALIEPTHYLMRIAANTHHTRQTKIKRLHREPSFFHESDQKTAETRIDVQWNTMLNCHLKTIIKLEKMILSYVYLRDLFDGIDRAMWKVRSWCH